MTISFHHHFRNGDFVFNKVMRVIIDQGIKNLTLAPSSLTGVMNDIVIEAIKKGTITNITSSGMRGSLGDFVSHGGLKNPVIFVLMGTGLGQSNTAISRLTSPSWACLTLIN